GKSLQAVQKRIEVVVKRPWARFSLEFGRLLPPLDLASEGEINELLHVSTLNYSVLKIMGKVNIIWTYAIGSHLEFDRARRKLMLFRLPSYCALCCTSDEQLQLFARYRIDGLKMALQFEFTDPFL